jgi:hypothetical protein
MSTPDIHAKIYLLGARSGTGLRCRGTDGGSPGDGRGRSGRSWKLKREDVDDNGPFSIPLGDGRRTLSRGDFLAESTISACV